VDDDSDLDIEFSGAKSENNSKTANKDLRVRTSASRIPLASKAES